MASSSLNRLRRLWFNVHLWIGVGLFVLLVPLGFSGTSLAWRPELERLLNAERYAVGPAGPALQPSAYLGSARAALGEGGAPSRIAFPSKPGDPVVVSSFGRGGFVNVWEDPASGRVLSKGPVFGGFIGLMHEVHEEMLIGRPGRQLVGWLGVAMLIQSLTGLWLWWPRGGFLKGLRWKRSPFLEMRWHHLIGFWVSIPLAILAATGIWIAFPGIGQALSGQHASARAEGPPRGFGPPLSQTQHTADEALAAVLNTHQGARPASLALPSAGPEPAWTVQLDGGERPTTVRISDATLEPVHSGPPAFGSLGGGDRRSRAMREIHDGDEGGIVWKLIISLTGLAPLILALTGVIRWLMDLRRRRVGQTSQEAAG